MCRIRSLFAVTFCLAAAVPAAVTDTLAHKIDTYEIDARALADRETFTRVDLPIRVSGSPTGPLNLAFRAILADADLSVTMVDLPGARRRRDFIDGRIGIDCCLNPRWLRPGEDPADMHFSTAFYSLVEHYIFTPVLAGTPATREVLLEKRYATIAGYYFEGDEILTNRVTVRDWGDVVRVLTAGRADFAFINDLEYHWRRSHGTIPKTLKLGPVHDRYSVHVRLHDRYRDLLPAVNAAIDRLTESGRIAALIEEGVHHVPVPEHAVGHGPSLLN